MTTQSIHVVTWRTDYNEAIKSGIIGIFDDELKATEIFDALEEHGSTDKTYYLDKYPINEVLKGVKS